MVATRTVPLTEGARPIISSSSLLNLSIIARLCGLRHRAAHALDQPVSEQGFERAHLLADGGLRDVIALRRARKAARLHKITEDL
jgi:hypothetical protein